jgi:hypothetical protein
MLTSGLVLFHNNSHPHIAAPTQALKVFDHPPYSPDLTLSGDYHQLISLKNWLGSQFNYNEELKCGSATYRNFFPYITSASRLAVITGWYP